MNWLMMERLGRQGGGGRGAKELLESLPWDTGQKPWSRPQAAGGHSWARCSWWKASEVMGRRRVLRVGTVHLSVAAWWSALQGG